MEFFKKLTKIDFMGLRKYTVLISIAMILFSIIALATKGLNLGLDFTGGTQIELHYPEAKPLDSIRSELSDAGFEDVRVQSYGAEDQILIRLQNKTEGSEKEVAKQVFETLKLSTPDLELMKVEIVGAEVGERLVEKGGMAILVSLLATMLYIAFRFEYRLAISSVIALIHDPILTLGLFAALQIEFDLPALAAVLSVLGYSLNDTIVVFDRVRENFRLIRQGSAIDIMNLSINQTLSRTIMTSGLTLLVVVALLLYGGESLFGFSFALFVGIIIGTYSSIYVAGTLAIKLGLNRNDMMPAKKVTSEI